MFSCLALEAKSLIGEWNVSYTLKDENGIVTTSREIALFLETGAYYNEGFVAICREEDDLRLTTFGGPSRGEWTIEGNEFRQTLDKVTIEFFSSAIDEFDRAEFRKIIAEESKKPTIYVLVSATKNKIIFKDKEDGTVVTYNRREAPKDKEPSWNKLLSNYPINELGAPPNFNVKNLRDPAGERFRRYSKSHLDYDGFKFSPFLPTYNERDLKGQLRSKEEIAIRILCNYICWAFVYIPEDKLPNKVIETYLEKHQLNNWLTKKEKEILSSDRGKAEQNYGNSIGWKLENTWALAWVLGFEQDIDIDQIPFGDATAPALLKFMQALAKNPKEFLKTCTVRPLVEVIQTEDIFYCTHNAVRSAQTGKEGTVPAGFHPIRHGGIIHEKRHSLTWVLSPGIAWDDTDLST